MQSLVARGKITALQVLKRKKVGCVQDRKEQWNLCSEYISFMCHKDGKRWEGASFWNINYESLIWNHKSLLNCKFQVSGLIFYILVILNEEVRILADGQLNFLI